MSWTPLDGYGERYEINRAGQVRIRDTGYVLKATTRYDGYLFYSFAWPGGRDVVMVHTLIARAFIGPRPAGQFVRHLNGINTDNRPENLAYGTPQDNSDDARRHGMIAVGEANGQSKLTATAVEAIRTLGDMVPSNVIAQWLRVSPSIIRQAKTGGTWRFVTTKMTVEQALRTIFKRQKASYGIDANALAAQLRAAYDAENIAESGGKC